MGEEVEEMGEEIEGQENVAAWASRDRGGLCVSQVRLALQMGLAPIVGEATAKSAGAARARLRAASARADGGSVGGCGGLARASSSFERARRPHPVGMSVLVNNDGATFQSRTTSTAQALPSGDVLVQVEHMVGSVRAEDLSLR